MTPRQQEELARVKMGLMFEVKKRLKDVGRAFAEVLLDAYEERLAMIAEGREPTDDDITAAWESVLGL